MTAPTHHMGVSAGPLCVTCQRREAECARRQGCCPRCTHFLDLDANGNDRTTPLQHRTAPNDRCGSDRGYWQHRARRETPCGPCVTAHLQARGLTA